MDLSIIRFERGSADLGSWGSLELNGPTSATIRAFQTEDIDIPEEVASGLSTAIIILNDPMGRILFLPYAGEAVLALDLTSGKPTYPITHIPRDEDRGMRTADFRFAEGLGILYLTEGTVALFTEDLWPSWRHDEDLMGWSIEGLTSKEFYLSSGDWAGHEEHQTRSLADGAVL